MTQRLSDEELRARHLARCRRNYVRKKHEYAARNAAWRAANPGRNVEYQRERKRERRALYIVHAVKAAAKKKGVQFDLTVDWVQARLDHGVCEVSGIAFDLTGRDRKKIPSIDRIIPGGDYVKTNCRMVVFGINSSIGRRGEVGVARALSRLMRGDVAHVHT